MLEPPVKSVVTVKAAVHGIPEKQEINANDLAKSLAEKVIMEIFKKKDYRLHV